MVDETIMPTKQPVRRVPIAIKEQLQKELQRMEEMGVIAKEEQPTDWISSLVTVKKPNGKIRVCIDPKPLNRALIRSQYLMPTLEDLLPELAEARIFSVLDVRNGFWHISLDDQSSKLTRIWYTLWKISLEEATIWRIYSTRDIPGAIECSYSRNSRCVYSSR